jgi:DNA-binding response OmpR family regulator
MMKKIETSEKTKVLIIEDEETIRSGLCDVFVYNGYEAEAVGEGKEGLKKALSGRYHLIVLDIMLPGMDGLTICNEIRKKDRAQPIILLTAKGDEEDIIQGLKLGADDYIPKPFSVRELVARAEAVLRRSPKLMAEKDKMVWGDLEVDPQNLRVNIRGRVVELTRREVDLLRYLIKHSDRPVGRKELLKEVWGYGNTEMETRTVDIHMAKLRRKIEPDPETPTYVVTVRGEGYRIQSS